MPAGPRDVSTKAPSTASRHGSARTGEQAKRTRGGTGWGRGLRALVGATIARALRHGGGKKSQESYARRLVHEHGVRLRDHAIFRFHAVAYGLDEVEHAQVRPAVVVAQRAIYTTTNLLVGRVWRLLAQRF